MCSLIVHEAFNIFYGNASSAEDAMSMILVDLINDSESD